MQANRRDYDAISRIDSAKEEVFFNMQFNEIKLVIGLDIGDGDSVAYAREMTGKGSKLAPLYLHKSRDSQVVKSAVAKKRDGTIIIGADAAKQKDFVINFKRSPKKWHDISARKEEYRQHMFDYIKGVSKVILQNNSNRNTLKDVITFDDHGNACWKKKEVLLVVGCPASVIWKGKEMRKQYEQLISEATGIQNVIVTEESRAAVFSLFEIHSSNVTQNLQKGVLVIDFGSSTADATYLLPGKKTIHLSWELGAAQIEYAMLDFIVKDRKTQKLLAEKANQYQENKILVAKEQSIHAIFQLREEKENFFDGILDEEDTEPKTVSVFLINEDGDLISEKETDLLLEEESDLPLKKNEKHLVKIDLRYCVTKKMIDYAKSEYQFEAKKDDVIVSNGTWIQNCQHFLADVKQTLEKENLPIKVIVVTGGGSNMAFTTELTKEEFSERLVVSSNLPSHSVVKGLATIAYNEVKAPAVRKKAIEEILESCKPHRRTMIDQISREFSEKAYDAVISALESYVNQNNGATNVGEITQMVEQAIQCSIAQNKKTILFQNTKSWNNSDVSEIVRILNQAATELYADKAMQDMVQIRDEDLKKMNEKLSFPNSFKIAETIATNTNLLGTMLGMILGAVLFVILVFLAAWIPILIPLIPIIDIYAWIEIMEWCQNHSEIPILRIFVQGTIWNMRQNRQHKIYEIKSPIEQALYDTFTKPEIYDKEFHKHDFALREMTEKAFDKILLKTDEESQDGNV